MMNLKISVKNIQHSLQQEYEVITMIIIFDLDGTLVNSIKDLANAVNYGLSELGYPKHSTESYKQMVGNGAKKLCYRALPDDKKEDTEKLYTIFKEYYNWHYLDNTKLYKGIKNLIHNIFTYGRPVALSLIHI